MKIFFDFDGTLVEIMKRDYRVYCDSLPDSTSLDFARYVSLRRKKTNIDEILSLTHPNYRDIREKFLQKRDSLIENAAYLRYDTVLQGVKESLSQISSNHECYILSARKDEKALKDQCDEMDISQYFLSIIAVSSPEKKGGIISSIKGNEVSIMVGDTENDILAARESGSISVSVDTGIRDKETIGKYYPDHITINLSELIGIIEHVRQQQRE